MTNQTHDAQVRRAIEEIAVPPLSKDFTARVVAAARESEPDHAPTPARITRPRRTGHLALAAAALVAAATVVGGFIGASITHAPAQASASAPVLSFTPATDWNSVVAPLPSKLQASNQVAWASNVPFQGSDTASGWPIDTVKRLPSQGVVVFASLAHQVDNQGSFPERSLPLQLSDGYFLASGYEGQPAPNVSLQMVYAHVNGHYLLIQVWFGQNKPTDAQTQAANTELARLTVPTQ